MWILINSNPGENHPTLCSQCFPVSMMLKFKLTPQGVAGPGIIHVDSVILDGAEIPHFLLELFVEKYLKPKYPDVGLDARVALPDKIDTATIGKHILTVVQK